MMKYAFHSLFWVLRPLFCLLALFPIKIAFADDLDHFPDMDPLPAYVTGKVILYAEPDLNAQKIIELRPVCRFNAYPAAEVWYKDLPDADDWLQAIDYYCIGKSTGFFVFGVLGRIEGKTYAIKGFVRRDQVEIATSEEITMPIPGKKHNKTGSTPHFQLRLCLEPECPIIYDSEKDDSAEIVWSDTPQEMRDEDPLHTCTLNIERTKFVEAYTGGWLPIYTSTCYNEALIYDYENDASIRGAFIHFIELSKKQGSKP